MSLEMSALIIIDIAANINTGHFIDLDHNSGGYPVLVNSPFKAKIWSSIEEAQKYIDIFKDRKFEFRRFMAVVLSQL